MEKLKEIKKYAIISISVGLIFGVVKYFQNDVVNIAEILKSTGVLFVVLCVMGILIVPISRKVMGFKKDGTRPE